MTERERLLALLPRLYRKDAVAVSCLTVAYAGPGTLVITITASALVLEGAGGAPSLTFDADDPLLTLREIVDALTNVGVDATFVNLTDASLVAGTLAEESALAVTPSPVILSRWSNPLWRVFDPIGRALARAALNLDGAIAQLNLLMASGYFADYWGTLLGAARRAGELDEPYTARQLHEILRHRENNEALAAILEEEGHLHVLSIRDLRRDVFTVSGTPLRGQPLAGPHFNAAVCRVELDGFPTAAISHAARLHAAAGVTMFVQGRFDLLLASQLSVRIRDLQIADPPLMQIGVTPVGVGRIGGAGSGGGGYGDDGYDEGEYQ